MKNSIVGNKVSIIIPYYNTMEYFEDCLNSLLLQSYHHLSMIIINDGSDQENTSFLESLLKDPRIIYLKNDEPKGAGYSRNRGLKAAKGDYVFFLDSDDFLLADAIRLLVENIKDAPAISGKKKKLRRISDAELLTDLPEFTVSAETPAKLFKGGSILNVLIRREFLEEHHLAFSQETAGFTDIAGIIPFILGTEKIPRLNLVTYYKRIGNNPLTSPRLVQRPIEERIREFIDVYMALNRKYGQLKSAKEYLDRLLLKYYRKTHTQIFHDPEKFAEFFRLYGTAVSMLDRDSLEAQPLYMKYELKMLKRVDRRKFQTILRLHVLARNLKNALKNRKKFKRFVAKRIFLVAARNPVKKDLIVFESFQGKQFSDSPRAIYQYLKEHYPEFNMYWSMDPRFQSGFPVKEIPCVKRFSIGWLLLMARAGFWVTNSRMPLWLPKHKDTIYLQTWHGTPLKKLAQDQKEVLMPGTTTEKYKKNFYKESRNLDYLVLPNRYSTEIFKHAFLFNKTIVESGYPRNDAFYSKDRDQRSQAFKISHGLPLDKKIILYAPTWRDNQYHKVGSYKMDLQLDLDLLRKELGHEYAIILRMHYLVAETFDLTAYKGFAYDFSKHDDIQDLYLVSDLLITDYSSVFFDYANLKRPMIFFTYDIDEYKGDIRGFYFNFEAEAPGPIVKTTEEVIAAIKNLADNRTIADQLDRFYNRFCSKEDGHASERVVNEVILKNAVGVPKTTRLNGFGMALHLDKK